MTNLPLKTERSFICADTAAIIQEPPKCFQSYKNFAVAFYGNSSHPQLVALVAQDEIMTSSGQVEPPGMHLIYLPYSDDIRHVEELHTDPNSVPHATDDQIKKASVLLRRIDLKDFSVRQFANPGKIS